MEELEQMTDKQAKRQELLTRIDEIDRWQIKVTDNELKEEMQRKKEALRQELAAL